MKRPKYRELHESGELRRRAEAALEHRKGGCRACPRECGREEGGRGACGREDHAVVAYAAPYFADEACLVGDGGTGAIFFAGCNLRCSVCKSQELSRQTDLWREVSHEDLASFMISLERRGCTNVSLVTPSHVVAEVLFALDIAAGRGLSLPIVYNTSTYDRVETLRLLEGCVDVYLPDIKFSDPDIARRYTFAEDYPAVAREAVREMHRQVGDLRFDGSGLAVRGLLVRHLVLPEDTGGAGELVRFLREDVSPDTCVSFLGSYTPPPHLMNQPPLDRRPTHDEILDAIRIAREAGLRILGEDSSG
jgi:putative pyruvate formate lyase activating enzyme